MESVFENFDAINSNEFVPNILPYYGNRYLILDKQEEVLSIMNDIIYWSDNLCKGLAMDIFDINHQNLEKAELIKNNYWNKLAI